MTTTPRRLAFALCLILSSALLCNAQEQGTKNGADAPAPVEPAAVTASGTAGKVAKFSGPSSLTNSIMTESGGKIGVNSASPAAVLHVTGPQPAPAAANGTNAAPALHVFGGKGGNTTGSGTTAGHGADINLIAGQGGNAPSGSTNGSGGNIFLLPGSSGTGGGAASLSGNVFLAPLNGAVALGTYTPPAGSKLYAVSSASDVAVILGENKHSQGEFNIGVRGLSLYGTGLWGNGATAGVQGYGKTGVFGSSTSGSGAGVKGDSVSGNGVHGHSQGTAGSGVFGENTGTSGVGVTGIAGAGRGVYGQSTSSSGVFGFSGSGDGVVGQSSTGYAGNFLGKAKVTGNFEVGGVESFGATTRQMLNLYNTTYAIGVQPFTFYFRTDSSFNWYKGGVHSNTAGSAGAGGTRLMNLTPAGELFVTGAVHAPGFLNSSDRNLKANFSTVNPRAVLDRLAAVPVQTWNYKGETVRHMGPMAQDFRAAFNLGVDDTGISTIDSAGVTMAAVQGLYQLSQEKDRQIEKLTAEAKTLRSELDELRARMLQLEEALKRQQK
ncbi:MAG TPA: tail fiber domain-containing protein [Pyrinomonadaceae bacterium]|nr:tail fiber domain-containing protein [Pyrinomonadaceae bacterium]